MAMKKLSSNLFKKFEDSKFSNLTACVGGAWYNSKLANGTYDRYNPDTKERVPSCKADDWKD